MYPHTVVLCLDSVAVRLAMCHHVSVVLHNCSPHTFVGGPSTFVSNVLISAVSDISHVFSARFLLLTVLFHSAV
jgi:hypothetical protein